MRQIKRYDFFVDLNHYIKTRTGLDPKNPDAFEHSKFEPGSYAQGFFDGGSWGLHRLLFDVESLKLQVSELEDELHKVKVKQRIFEILGRVDDESMK